MLAQDEESRKAELAEKQKALSGAKKRMEVLDRIIQHIYEDNVLGKLSDSRYLKLSRQYEKEQAEIERLAAVLEREIETQPGKREWEKAGANRPVLHLCGANPHPIEDWPGVPKRIGTGVT